VIITGSLKALEYIFIEPTVLVGDFRREAGKLTNLLWRPIARSAFERQLSM
jgi:hypothetical protein